MLWKNVLVVSLYTVLGSIYLRKKNKEKKLLRNERFKFTIKPSPGGIYITLLIYTYIYIYTYIDR